MVVCFSLNTRFSEAEMKIACIVSSLRDKIQEILHKETVAKRFKFNTGINLTNRPVRLGA